VHVLVEPWALDRQTGLAAHRRWLRSPVDESVWLWGDGVVPVTRITRPIRRVGRHQF
jgi:hypothetical protein